MNVLLIAAAALALIGIGCFFAPRHFTRSDQRDDPEAAAKVKKLGLMFIAYAAGAVLLALKYNR